MRGVSHKKELALAFFVGAAVSSIAFDFSDYFFYSASASGTLDPFRQAFLFAVFPTIYYASFVALGYFLFKFTKISAVWLLYFYGATIIAAVVLTLSLPQITSEPVFLPIALSGVAVSFGSIWALSRRLR